MRKFIQFFALLLTFSTLLVSCQKEYDSTPDIEKGNNENPLSGHLTFDVDGFLFKSESKSAAITEVDGVKSLVLSGTKYADNKLPGVFEQIVIIINNYNPDVKRYDFGSTAQLSYSRVDGGSTMIYVGQPGENNFIFIDGAFKGYFNGVVKNSTFGNDKLVISNGSFEIPR
ncbi:MAG TPA: hypothetical protein VLZ83_06050 [Edaphocola sp.]|nr:hypothetical protein [Edaphocola sp.]